MPIFTHRVVTDSGTVLEKESDAVDMESLRRELEEKGYFILNIRPSVSGGGAAKGWDITKLPLFKKRGIKTRDLIIFNQELLALINA